MGWHWWMYFCTKGTIQNTTRRGTERTTPNGVHYTISSLTDDQIMSRRQGHNNCPEHSAYLQLSLMISSMWSGFSRHQSVKFHLSVKFSILQCKFGQPFS